MPYSPGETVICKIENYSTFTDALTNADEIYVSIDDPNGNNLINLYAPTNDSTGIYFFNYLLVDSVAKGVYTITWKVIKNTIITKTKDSFEVV